MEGWLPPADDENSSSSVQDGDESPPAKDGVGSDARDDDDDEPREDAALMVRKTRGQHQRELEASRSLECHDDDEIPEHTSHREATPLKKKKKKKEVKAPPKRKTKPAKQASPPHSASSSDATSLAKDEAPQTTATLDATVFLSEVPLASLPPYSPQSQGWGLL